ncbi:methyl-accepting chemotaxis protein [Paucibacter sp. KCTC 42545]|uniref:methyl-accepting chemotaxis protein n=1 Tax=Paucibacter sp. KCTC 42545 TaxID=1768242 RepID=UPI000733BF2B|nr:methyl-accepting chemotaxis protein [Paucibacter sp. KCTC 42545]ALT76375.1 hypothetical protein AT984_03285 [Paucibacter sp. KCTC 42545]
MRLSDYRLSTQLIGAFVIVTTVMALVGLFAVLQMGRINDADTLLYERELVGLSLVKEAKTDIALAGRAVRAALLAPSMDARKQAQEQVQKAVKEAKSNIDKAVPLFWTEKGKEQMRQLQSEWAGYEAVIVKLEKLTLSAPLVDATDASDYLFGDAAKQTGRIQELMSTLSSTKEAVAKQTSDDNDAIYDSSRNISVLLIALGMGLGIGLGWFISRQVTVPLARAAEVAGAMSGGDMSIALHAEGRNETSQLLQALEGMRLRLRDIVATVRSNAENVATGSGEIAQGNADLSQRTEEQASALEQTAATMDQLSSTVRNNADNAKQANQLALNASQVATRGGHVVGEVVETMKGINDSSKRISDIISVIDGIAFQTNILALNAAVEAARAGEQGRGFAVVASEVRSLAQRSAEAAKEIKNLINASVERVEQGTVLVDKAGETMTEIVGSIKRVTDIVGEISASSTEQSLGISQVGEAITQMDKVTQQNAALVEESAAAAESLRQQADQLVGAVAFFKTR